MATWGSTSDPNELPTFEEIRASAHGELGDVLDTLRSDWRPGCGPDDGQAEALREARRAIASARSALDDAARTGWED